MIEILENIPLSQYSSYKTGGNALYFAAVKDNAGLKYALEWANKNRCPFEIIGGGSNIIVNDDGYKGLIIYTGSLNRFIMRLGNVVTVGAGVKISELVNFSIDRSLSGMQELSGIPGRLGGAAMMNAGAFNTEMKDRLLSLSVMDSDGGIRLISNAEAAFGYRSAEGLDGYIVTELVFGLQYGDADALKAKRAEILEKRKLKQPLDKPSCGSVFKRPIDGYAGDYIERAGLKGRKIGGAIVAEKHANFILNIDNAKSSDIVSLIRLIQKTVYDKFNVQLQPEVRFIGF